MAWGLVEDGYLMFSCSTARNCIMADNKNPVIALYFAIGADFTGMVPALIKTYHHPETEVWTFYTLDIFAALFSILALSKWTVAEYSYPIYIMLINVVMTVLIVRLKT